MSGKNAVFHATWKRLRDLPLTLGRIEATTGVWKSTADCPVC